MINFQRKSYICNIVHTIPCIDLQKVYVHNWQDMETVEGNAGWIAKWRDVQLTGGNLIEFWTWWSASWMKCLRVCIIRSIIVYPCHSVISMHTLHYMIMNDLYVAINSWCHYDLSVKSIWLGCGVTWWSLVTSDWSAFWQGDNGSHWLCTELCTGSASKFSVQGICMYVCKFVCMQGDRLIFSMINGQLVTFLMPFSNHWTINCESNLLLKDDSHSVINFNFQVPGHCWRSCMLSRYAAL